MAKRKWGDNLQHSNDEESQPQSEYTDTLAFENLESCNAQSVTEEKDDVETENNDGHEDIDRTENTAESLKNTSSFVKKQISKQPPTKMKKT
jgi:Vacuolar import and degradation protein